MFIFYLIFTAPQAPLEKCTRRFLADSRLTTEIDIDSLILNGLLSERQASDPESYEILMAIADGLSERAGAERLHMPRNTFVYKRNQLLKRLKEKP